MALGWNNASRWRRFKFNFKRNPSLYIRQFVRIIEFSLWAAIPITAIWLWASSVRSSVERSEAYQKEIVRILSAGNPKDTGSHQ